MPKMKTKSSAKKRFKITAHRQGEGAAAAGKRHGMIKRSQQVHPQCARHDGAVRSRTAKIIKQFLPNGSKSLAQRLRRSRSWHV